MSRSGEKRTTDGEANQHSARRGKAWVVSARVNGTQQRKSCRTREAVRLRKQRLHRLPYRADISVALPPTRDTGYAREDKIDEVSAVLRYGVVSTTRELREHGRDDAVP